MLLRFRLVAAAYMKNMNLLQFSALPRFFRLALKWPVTRENLKMLSRPVIYSPGAI